VLAAVVVLTRSKAELSELIKLERWRQTKLDAEIATLQCRLLRLGEQLHSTTTSTASSSLTSSSQVQQRLLTTHAGSLHGRRNRGRRVSGCSPKFWGGVAVLPRKFVDVAD